MVEAVVGIGESNHLRVEERWCEVDFVHPQYVPFEEGFLEVNRRAGNNGMCSREACGLDWFGDWNRFQVLVQGYCETTPNQATNAPI